MLKNITGITLGTILIFCLGYLAIEWNHDKFMKLCQERPSIKECPAREIGIGAP